MPLTEREKKRKIEQAKPGFTLAGATAEPAARSRWKPEGVTPDLDVLRGHVGAARRAAGGENAGAAEAEIVPVRPKRRGRRAGTDAGPKVVVIEDGEITGEQG